MAMLGHWSKELIDRQVWALVYTLPAEHRPDGYDPRRAYVRWAHRITHEALTIDWIVDALNTRLDDVTHRTWTALELDSDPRFVRLLHNGFEVGEIEWHPTVRPASRDLLTGRAVAALNIERGRQLPCPAPVPPAAPYFTADHDYATGENLDPTPVVAA